MITANIEVLRDNLPQVEAWLQSGEEIELTRQGQPIARLAPLAPQEPAPRPLVKVDFAKRHKGIWGDRVFSDEEIREMREAELGDRS